MSYDHENLHGWLYSRDYTRGKRGEYARIGREEVARRARYRREDRTHVTVHRGRLIDPYAGRNAR